MKRRLELNNAIQDNSNSGGKDAEYYNPHVAAHVNGFFKRHKGEVQTEKLIEIALSYKGKLNHLSSTGNYLSQVFLGMEDVANEFILYFCDEIGAIPAAIKEEVLNKFQKRKIQGTEFNLCCWEFLCLVFFDTGLISKELIDELCYIVFKSNEHSDDIALTLGDAFHKEDFKSYQKHTPETLPSPGDLLLFTRANGDMDPNRVCHMAICVNDRGGFIELESDCVSDNNLKDFYQDEQEILEFEAKSRAKYKEESKYESDSDTDTDTDTETENKTAYDLISVYYVPFKEIQHNIQNFRNAHQNLVDLKITGKKDEQTVLNELKNTQYAELVQNYYFVDTLLESINLPDCSLPLFKS